MQCDLIIPALDEAPNIDALFDALDPFRGQPLRHVILADNGSTDETPDRARARGAVVTREPKRGYGAACLRALAWIEACGTPPDVVVFLDADRSDDPAALPDLLRPIAEGRAEITIGSRVRQAEPGALNFVQKSGNRLACALMRLASGRRYHDLGPFRAVRYETLRRLDLRDRTWGWTVELQLKAALDNVPVVEVDVPYRRRRSGRSKISQSLTGTLRAGTKIITTILVIWWRHRRKK